MSYEEFYQWMEHYQKEPFSSDRQELQMAQLMSLVAGFGGSKTKPKDFMISKQEKEQMTQKEYSKSLITAFKSI